jgi:hypothetical protein
MFLSALPGAGGTGGKLSQQASPAIHFKPVFQF